MLLYCWWSIINTNKQLYGDLKSNYDLKNSMIYKYYGDYLKDRLNIFKKRYNCFNKIIDHDVLFTYNVNDSILKIMKLMNKKTIEDYNKFINNDSDLIKELKQFWETKLNLKLQETYDTINKEENDNKENLDFLMELNVIKTVFNDYPKMFSEELKNKNSTMEILEYWPNLLLPSLLDL